MSAVQLEFTAQKPVAIDELANLFEDRLLYFGHVRGIGWMSRRDLSIHGFSPRECRACCEHLGARVISGQNGYKLTRFASVDEITACANAYMSQARKMVKKAVALKRIAHGMVG